MAQWVHRKSSKLLLDIEHPLSPQVSDYERRAGERDADAHRRERLVHGVGDDEGGRAGAQVTDQVSRRHLLAEVRHLAQQTHYVEAAAEKEDIRVSNDHGHDHISELEFSGRNGRLVD